MKARQDILMSLTSKLREANRVTIDCEWLAKRTPGYVGADLVSLVSEAGVVAVNRIFGRLYGGEEEKSADKMEIEEDTTEGKSLATLMSEVMTETTTAKNIVRTLSPSNSRR